MRVVLNSGEEQSNEMNNVYLHFKKTCGEHVFSSTQSKKTNIISFEDEHDNFIIESDDIFGDLLSIAFHEY